MLECTTSLQAGALMPGSLQDFFGDQADIAGARSEMVAPKTKREV